MIIWKKEGETAVSGIHWHGKAPVAIKWRGKDIIEIRASKNGMLFLKSCFGSGIWINNLVWDDADVWKN